MRVLIFSAFLHVFTNLFITPFIYLMIKLATSRYCDSWLLDNACVFISEKMFIDKQVWHFPQMYQPYSINITSTNYCNKQLIGRTLALLNIADSSMNALMTPTQQSSLDNDIKLCTESSSNTQYIFSFLNSQKPKTIKVL